MKRYDFDTLYDRHGSSCLKYDFAPQRVGRTDLLPLWVADMDFRLPDEILDVLHDRVSHGFFGYTDPDSAYYDVLEKWFEGRYQVRIDRSWNTVTPGIVYAISCAIRSFTREGDAVLIQEPVYYPFREMIEGNGRVCVSNDLVLKETPNLHFEIDFADLEEKLRSSKAKLMLLCSPHNPAGRVFSKKELETIADICLRHDVILLVDEIHCDFIFQRYRFTPFLSLDPKYREHAIICTSASKSFSIAGLQTANILIPNPELRRRFQKVNAATGYSQGNVF
ncbi:MAG: MalY/PatB family protein, partial [Lachnospiraceae bacterium]